MSALLIAGCSDADPLAERLAQRALYSADVVTFSDRGDGTFLVELEVRTEMGPSLNMLTVTIRQHDDEQLVLTRERVPVDISAMDATGVVRVYAQVPRHSKNVASLSAVVERTPAATDYGEFPEIREVSTP